MEKLFDDLHVRRPQNMTTYGAAYRNYNYVSATLSYQCSMNEAI
jgi:hypothetical protein